MRFPHLLLATVMILLLQAAPGHGAVGDGRPSQSHERSFRVVTMDVDGGTLLRAVNGMAGPVEVEISLPEKVNVTTSRPLPQGFVVPPGSARDLVRIAPRDSRRGWSWRYDYRYLPGDPAAVHRPEGPYLVPFAPGVRGLVTQGFNGRRTHHGTGAVHAVDIALPEGTSIRAARRGVVLERAGKACDDGGKNAEPATCFLRILHPDGTMALYGHLLPGSVAVVAGDGVAAGQVIARSGNSGNSTGPHLHFVVQRNVGMGLESVPFAFAGPDGRARRPARGTALVPR